jgi:hypothetical protein
VTSTSIVAEGRGRPSSAGEESLSLGWVPFKNQTIRLTGSLVVFNGHKVRLWKHRDIEGRIKSGSFSQGCAGALVLQPRGRVRAEA